MIFNLSKRYISILVLTVILGTSLGQAIQPNTARAAPSDSMYLAVAEDRCKELIDYLDNETGNSQYSALFRLQMISELSFYVSYFITYRSALSISDNELNHYIDLLDNYVGTFNKSFSKKSKNFTKLTLHSDFSSHKKTKESIKKNIVLKIPNYIKSLLKQVDSTSTTSKSNTAKVPDAKNNIASVLQPNNKTKDVLDIEDFKVLLKNIYELYDVYHTSFSDISSITPLNKNNRHPKFSISYKNETDEDAMEKAVEDYSKFLTIGKQEAEKSASSTELSIDLKKDYVENLADVVSSKEGIQIPEKPTLSLAYMAYLSASSVYTPLESYAGNTEFNEALRSLTEDSSLQANLIAFYSKVKDLRKPLYYRKLDDSGKPTGSATLLTIDKFFEYIKDGTVGGLCTVNGEFRYNTNSQSWLYYLDELRTGRESNSSSVSNQSLNPDEEDIDGLCTDSSLTQSDEYTEDGSSDENPSSNGSENPSNNENSTTNENITTSSKNEMSSDNLLSKQSVNGFSNMSFSKKRIIENSPNIEEPNEDSNNGNPNTEDNSNNTEDSNEEDSNEDNTENSNNTEDNNNSSEGTDLGLVTEKSTSVDSGVVEEDNAVFAYETITDDSKLSEPVLLFGTEYSRDVDNMTSFIMQNIIKNTSNTVKIKDKNTRYLYMNSFGDVVTDDNLVILPGAANPIIYTKESQYNPFTVAFMNSYPVTLKNTSYFQLSSKADIDKFMLFGKMTEKDNAITSIEGEKISSLSSIKTTAPIQCRDIVTNFTLNGSDSIQLLKPSRLIFGSQSEWNSKNKLFFYNPIVLDKSAAIEGQAIFPYVSYEDSSFKIARAICSNMYNYLTLDKSGTVTNLGKLNDNYILHHFIINNVNGTNNPQGFTKNQLLQYEQFVNNSYNRFEKKLLDLSKNLYDKITHVTGILGLQSSYDDVILGKVFSFVRDNWVIFGFILTILLLIAFVKMRKDLLETIILFIASMATAYFLIMIAPVYLPMIYNIVLNNVNQSLSFEILATKSEYNDTVDVDPVLDSDGRYKFNTSSITLFRQSATTLSAFQNSVNAESSELTGGNIVLLNQESGLYAQGDSVKVNTDLLMSTLKIQHDDSEKDNNHLVSYKTVSNNIDYYTPYYQFVDGFIGKLNTFSDVMQLPRKTSLYLNNRSKDNYMVCSYVNSKPFLTPGDYTYSLPEDTTGMSKSDLEKYKEENDKLKSDLTQAFGSNADFLGISDVLYNPTKKMKQTLWALTLRRNGYYEPDWSVNNEKMDHLITYINFQTKKFIYDMEEQIGYLSDDTMIKMICLRALIAFNQEASDFGTWLYPFSINYEELSAQDVLNCVFTDDYNRFISMDMDIIDYVANTYGWFHVIIFDFLVILLFVVVWAIRIMVSLMYILLCVLLILKLVRQEELKTPLKGYFKCTGLAMVCSTALCLVMSLALKANASVVSIYLTLVVTLLIFGTVMLIMSSILHNITDFGNTALAVNIQGIANNVMKGKFAFSKMKIRAKNTQVVKDSDNDYYRNEYRDKYDRRYSFDSYEPIPAYKRNNSMNSNNEEVEVVDDLRIYSESNTKTEQNQIDDLRNL